MEGRDSGAGAQDFSSYVAAPQQRSIVWGERTVSNQCYYGGPECFANKVKFMIIFMNIYHFFIRKWCLPGCFSNLFATFTPAGPGSIKYGVLT